jgi:hypothetical protein
MVWENIGPDQRALMMDGYTAVIDPHNDVAEESGTNNEYTVRESTRVWMSWIQITAPYDMRDMVEYTFEARLSSGGSGRQVVNWHIGQDIAWGSCFRPYYCVRSYDELEYDTFWFDVAGDEVLVVEVQVTHPGTLHNPRSHIQVYGPENGWGAGPLGPRRTCDYLGGMGSSNPGYHYWSFGYHEGEDWSTIFHICREDAE